MRRNVCVISLLVGLSATSIFAQSGGGGSGGSGSAGGGTGASGTGGTGGSASTGSSNGGAGSAGQSDAAALGLGNGNITAPVAIPSSGGRPSGSAGTVEQRQRAAGVAAPSDVQRDEQKTIDQLNQKTQSTAGVTPDCPPSVTNCAK